MGCRENALPRDLGLHDSIPLQTGERVLCKWSCQMYVLNAVCVLSWIFPWVHHLSSGTRLPALPVPVDSCAWGICFVGTVYINICINISTCAHTHTFTFWNKYQKGSLEIASLVLLVWCVRRVHTHLLEECVCLCVCVGTDDACVDTETGKHALHWDALDALESVELWLEYQHRLLVKIINLVIVAFFWLHIQQIEMSWRLYPLVKYEAS